MGINNRQPVQLHKGKFGISVMKRKATSYVSNSSIHIRVGLLMAGGFFELVKVALNNGLQLFCYPCLLC